MIAKPVTAAPVCAKLLCYGDSGGSPVWVPSYNGVNSYLSGRWAPTGFRFEISADIYVPVNDLEREFIFFLVGESSSIISARVTENGEFHFTSSGDSAKSQDRVFTFGAWNSVRMWQDGTEIGFEINGVAFTETVTPTAVDTDKFRVGRYKWSGYNMFLGQIVNLRLSDFDTTGNNRFYKCIVSSDEMPTQQYVADSLGDGSTNLEMINFGSEGWEPKV